MKTFSKRPGTGERMRERSCPVCGSPRVRAHWECDGFRFVRCSGCGLVYQNPQPLFDDLRGRYDQEYFAYERENEEQFFRLMMLGLQDVGFFHEEERLRALGPFLDIGCATGRLLAEMRRRQWNVLGVEVCEPAARWGREQRRLDMRTGTLEESALPTESVAVAHFSHVIEHVPDPRAFLQEVHRVVMPGGIAVIVTPDAAGFQARLFGSEWRSAIADHMHLFSFATLRRLCRSLGFTVVRKRSWGGLAAGTAPGWLKRIADTVLKQANWGDVMAVLCRKPAS